MYLFTILTLIFHFSIQISSIFRKYYPLSMSFNKDLACNVKENTDDKQLKPKVPKKSKHKFIKELNHKTNSNFKSFQIHSNHVMGSKKNDVCEKKSDSKSSLTQSIIKSVRAGVHIIKGQWLDNKMNGSFLIEYQNGSKFQGIYENDLKIFGKMYYKFANCTYEGGFFGQNFSGFGKLSYEGGRAIEGQWDNMEFVGKATITYPNKDVYYGPVDENLYKHGEGHLFFHNGCKYIGGFKNGSITGFGSYYKGEQVIKTGLWNKGELMRQIENEERNIMGSQYYLSNFSKEIADLSMLNGKGTKQDAKLNIKSPSIEQVEESEYTQGDIMR